MSNIEQNIHTKVKQLLDEGKIRYFIGYESGSDPWHAAPSFIFNGNDAKKLVFNPQCVNNLAVYLSDDKKREMKKGENPDTGAIGILAKGCDSKALIQLLSENQIQRKSIVILGLPCSGVIDLRKLEKCAREAKLPAEAMYEIPLTRDGDGFSGEWKGKKYSFPVDKVVFDKCLFCTTPNTLDADEFFGDALKAAGSKNYSSVQELEALPVEKRWEFWSEQFSRCIRCSA